MVTAIGMWMCGLSSSYPQLLFWRFFTGIGSALQASRHPWPRPLRRRQLMQNPAPAKQMSGAQLYLADVSTRDNRARVLGANTSAALLGVSVGPAIGGNLAELSGTSAPFFVTGMPLLLPYRAPSDLNP